MTQPTLINLDPDEYSQGLCYYLFAVNLSRCGGSCNTLNNLSNRVSVPNKLKTLNLHIFKMIAGINESKALTKHYANVNVNLMIEKITQIKSGAIINVDVSPQIQKNIMCAKKLIFAIVLNSVVKKVNI